MASDNLVNTLKLELNTILKYKDANLISNPDWGTINFESARQDIEAALNIARDLSDLPLGELADVDIQNIQRSIPQVCEVLVRIDEFSISSGGTPTDQRDEICEGLHRAVEELRAHAINYIPYLAYKRGDIDASMAKLEKTITQAQGTYNESKTWIDGKKGEIEQIESAARAAAASAGVGTFTGEFYTEAGRLQKVSKKWLLAMGGLALVTIVAAILSYWWFTVAPDSGTWESLSNIASKAAIIAVLFTGTVWCGRIYRALAHQAAVNNHRALSLKTFQAFVEATDDRYVKDAVLMAATRTVFGNVPTGFVGTDGTQDSGVNFVEFGRSAAEKAVKKSQDSD